MIAYLKAEFNLCRKNRANFIIGACGLFIYCLLLLFSGVGGVRYAASISMFGFVTVLLFLIPWFLSPASRFYNRKKISISSEHMALMLGESKLTFVKNRIIVCLLHWFLLLCVVAVMQVPAFLIAGEKYSLSIFIIEIMAVTAFNLFSMIILFLCPEHKLMLGIPLWSGFCGGFVGGFTGGVFGDFERITEKEVVRMYVIIAVICAVLFAISVLYRYIKTVVEERRR